MWISPLYESTKTMIKLTTSSWICLSPLWKSVSALTQNYQKEKKWQLNLNLKVTIVACSGDLSKSIDLSIFQDSSHSDH